jgi:hypothetical protein
VNKLAFLLLLLCLMGCSQNNPNPPTMPTLEPLPLPVSLWGELELVSQAEQLAAPAFIPLDTGLFFAWTGSQEGEARLFSRGLNGRTQIMALKAYHPIQQRLFAGADTVLMLWLDRVLNTVDMRLQAALLSENGIAEVGVLTISDLPTRRYSSLMTAADVVTIVYSGSLGQVSNLYLQRIDTFARPFSQERLRIDADYPALIAQAENTLLFWLENNGEAAYFGTLRETELIDTRRLVRATIGSQEAVEDFLVGFDGTYIYLFWQIRAWDASRHILMSAGTPTGEFSSPIQLDAAWAIPAETATVTGLPVALNIGNQLGIAYFSGGAMGEFQPIVESGALLGAPTISLLLDGRLGLAWSQPTNRGFANLLYTEQD